MPKKLRSVQKMTDEELQRRLNCCRGDFRYNEHFGPDSEPRIKAQVIKAEMRKRGLKDRILNLVCPGRGRHKVRNF